VGVVWSKVWRDLAQNKARTSLVVLSTAVGVFALGLVFGLSGVLRVRIMESHRAAVPAHITFWGGPFSQETVDAMRREPGITATEGETATSFRWKLEGEEAWRDGDLVARADYDAQRVNLLRLQDGHWPDDRTKRSMKRALGIECLSSQYFNVPAGTTILVEFGDRERRVPVEGVVCAPVVLPPEWGGDAMFFATPKTAAWLSRSEHEEDFNRLHIILESYSEEAAQEKAKRIEDRLERMELFVGGYEITDPNEHWVQSIVDGVTMILMVVGVLSLGLSAFLIINTMNAILVQQMWQIGVMKAIGATFGRVVRVYLTTAFIYGALALLLAVPPGAVGAHLLAACLLGMFNVELAAFQISPVAIGIQVVVGLAVPLLAAAVPVIGSARVVAVKLDRPRRVSRMIEIAESVPGVVEAETWSQQGATLLLPSGEEHPVALTGIPSDSVIFKPNIVRGRSLRPDDGHALVFTIRLAEKEGIRVGDEITVSIGGEESEWAVVGHYLSVNDVSDEFFVPLDVLQRETGSFGRGRRVKVLSENDDIESQQQVIQGLKDAFAAYHFEVVGTWSASEQLKESQASFGILTSLLLAMVVLTAIVGSIGLMSTMFMNVVERRREIGVMRAVGASSLAIVGMFVAEGVLVGVLSWLLAVPLSYPGARLFSDLIGEAVLEMPLEFVYSASGMVLWLLIVAVLSVLASLWPALQATKVSVREALAYE
jgi:ABC-type antimicrobial peptide transport system permease subunit